MVNLNSDQIANFFVKTHFEQNQEYDDETIIILGLKAYCSATSILIGTYHYYFAAKESESIAASFSTLVFYDSLLTQLKRLHENKDSLSARVLELLEKDEVISFLVNKALMLNSRISERRIRENLKFIKSAWCDRNDGATGSPKAPSNSKLISRRNWSIRRAANKRVAHMTIDDYDHDELGITYLVEHSCQITLAIQKCFGSNIFQHDLRIIERESYDEAFSLFGVKHESGFLIS